MKIKSQTFWNIILVLSLILIIHGMSDINDPDKKTAEAAQDETVAGTFGAIASAIAKKQFAITGAVTVLILGGMVLAPSFLGRIVDIFRPQPTIPVWVYAAGFLVLLLMVLRRK